MKDEGNKSKVVVIVVVLLSLIVIAGFFYMNDIGGEEIEENSGDDEVDGAGEDVEIEDSEDFGTEDDGEDVEDSGEEVDGAGGEVHVVKVYATGFVPKQISIEKGDSVEFVNSDSKVAWVASVPHTTHDSYPGSHIDKCGSEDGEIFDSCGNLANGESFTFTFNEVGTWRYHDHTKASLSGTVVVIE